MDRIEGISSDGKCRIKIEDGKAYELRDGIWVLMDKIPPTEEIENESHGHG